MTERELALAQAFAALSANLEDRTEADYLRRVATTYTKVLQVELAVAVWAGPDQRLHPVTPMPQPSAELLEAVCGDSPAVDAYRSARPVRPALLTDLAGPWPAFIVLAHAAGYRAAAAVPLRHRDGVLGSVLLGASTESFPDPALSLARALADAAALGLAARRTLREHIDTNTHLRGDLQRRVMLQQAAGVLASVDQIAVADAVRVLHTWARRHHRPLEWVAAYVVAHRALPPAR
ncbi:GAF domain-containing protein [Streptomyces sp. NPDC006733]|uniref:GAF domain-containing protein n=1 Tax=Streptomyces sp. NPDC006733 TaxID=3155460 RepID=UPI0033D9F824